MTDTNVLDQIIDHLTGSCSTLEQACQVFNRNADELSEAETAYIDERVFLCEVCGWWCDPGELGEDPEGKLDLVCVDCAEESTDD